MRNQRKANAWTQGVYYAVSSAASGAAIGLALAALGIAVVGYLSSNAVAAFVAAISLVGVYMGAKEVSGRRVRLWQVNIETPQRWMHLGSVLWPVANGASLGLAVTSRLGFPIFYAIPAFVVAAQSLLIGAVVWGVYSFVRALLALPLGALIGRAADPEQTSLKVVGAIPQIRRITGFALACFSVLAGMQVILN